MIIVTSIFMIALMLAAASFSEMKNERDNNKVAKSIQALKTQFAQK